MAKTKEKIRNIWVKVQWWIGDRLMDLRIIKEMIWTKDNPWTIYYYA